MYETFALRCAILCLDGTCRDYINFEWSTRGSLEIELQNMYQQYRNATHKVVVLVRGGNIHETIDVTVNNLETTIQNLRDVEAGYNTGDSIEIRIRQRLNVPSPSSSSSSIAWSDASTADIDVAAAREDGVPPLSSSSSSTAADESWNPSR